MRIFVSYTSNDRNWAYWIGWQLAEAGHEPFVHEWEIGAGRNIPRWMEDRLGKADCVLGVFSDGYSDAIHSQSELSAAYWRDPDGRDGFLVPVEVSPVSKWPVLVKPLRRLSLVGLDEPEAQRRLLDFLGPLEGRPKRKPIFPGAPFREGSVDLGNEAPLFPAANANPGRLNTAAGANAGVKRPQPGPVRHTDDPQKGRWGGRANVNGRRLSALLTDKAKNYFWVDLRVESTDGSRLESPVFFHMHDSYVRNVQRISKIRDGRWAVYQDVSAEGAFTAGAQAKDGRGNWVGLEYDLSKISGLPRRFLK